MNSRIPRSLAVVLATVLMVGPALVAGPSSAAVPRAPFRYAEKIERLAGYTGQSICSPTAKRGTAAFANMLLRTYPRSRSLGIVRACTVGGTSEHKEGRAFDWGMNASSKKDRTQVKALMTWLLKKDKFGNRRAMARRLGIQYMIWNRRIWGSYAASSGWRRYTGSNPHTDHVHFSMSWKGARKNTSFWHPRGFTPPKPAPKPKPKPRPGTPPKPRSHALAEPRAPRTLQPGTALVSEQVSVNAKSRAGVVTKGALRSGRRYLIEASGTFRYAGGAGAVADAECSRAKGSDWWRDRSVRRDRSGADHLDLYVDGQDLFADSDNGESCDTRSHTYRWVYTPRRDGRVPLKVWDPTRFSDNRGSLGVKITDLGVRNEMSWRVPARSVAGATSPGSLAAGDTYTVTVSGTWRDGTGATLDAECGTDGSDNGWRRSYLDVSMGQLRGDNPSVRQRDVTGEPVTDSGGRCDATGHSYRFVWQAEESQPLNLRVQDWGGYGNNRGSLRVKVAPYVAPPEPETEPVRAETVQVDSARGTGVTTSQVYPKGTRLRLTAKGVYLMRTASSDWIAADAECTLVSGGHWRGSRFEGLFDGSRQPLGDVAVNGRIDTWRPRDGWGSCDRDNEYIYDLTTDRTGPLSLVIADDDYSDNRGPVSVTVEAR